MSWKRQNTYQKAWKNIPTKMPKWGFPTLLMTFFSFFFFLLFTEAKFW